MGSTPGEVTRILTDISRGNTEAVARLMPLVYDELRRLADHYMRSERPGHTLQATALVHEAFLRLVDQKSVTWQNRAHFIGVAAQAMRRILVNHARDRQADKRGGSQQPVPLEAVVLLSEEQLTRLVALDEALERLSAVDARQGRIVEMRFFGGLTVEETAEVLGVSPKTVKRDWRLARAWLYREIGTKGGTDVGPVGAGKSPV